MGRVDGFRFVRAPAIMVQLLRDCCASFKRRVGRRGQDVDQTPDFTDGAGGRD